MAGPKKPYQPDHAALKKIHDLCLVQDQFEDIDFEPLFDSYPNVLSVVGLLRHEDDVDDLVLTLWRGYEEGMATKAEPPRLWLNIRVENDLGVVSERTVPLEPDAPDLDIVTEDFADSYPMLAEGSRALNEMFFAAEPSHSGLVGSARKNSFDQLNSAVESALEEAEELEDEDYEAAQLELHSVSADSGFDTISFDLKEPDGPDGPQVFSTQAVVASGGRKTQMAMWVEPGDDELQLVLEMAGRRHPLPADASERQIVRMTGAKGDLKRMERALRDLRSIHVEAYSLFLERVNRSTDETLLALKALATNALSGGEPIFLVDVADHGYDYGPVITGFAWHDELQEFTRLCRLGLAGVVVEESPQGPGLNVRAVTVDPITHQEVALQVYWQKAGDGSDEPVHWLAAGSAAHPAHGGDPMHPELLAGFPQGSRDHIRHAIDHLHDLADLATEVVAAKVAETMSMLGDEGMAGDAADIVKGQIQDETLEDALAALNGIARLYTGSPDRAVRDS